MVTCPQCGTRLASRDRLPGHYRRAHRGRLPPRPSRSEIVRSDRESSPARPVQGETRIVPKPKPRLAEIPSGDGPPSWWEPCWEPQAGESWPLGILAGFSPHCDQLLRGGASTIRPPEATDRVILWSQFHALKALATRLDAGIATERERVAFEAGLRKYDANFDRVRAQRKALPG